MHKGDPNVFQHPFPFLAESLEFSCLNGPTLRQNFKEISTKYFPFSALWNMNLPD